MNAVTPEAIMQQSRGLAASQAAGVEHSRAIAEVQAAFTVAQRFPRDRAKALENALESCRTIEVASTAFYRFKRGGEIISDASIHLATELARCWGNINYGIMELSRDDVARMSEMLAYAIDLETNTMARQTFLVPHIRDTRNGPKPLADMRDIYENNANNGARRLREQIWRVLPPYLKERAKAECHDTIVRGQGDVPIAQLVVEATSAFAKIGVSAERLIAKLGPTNGWTREDIANLEVTIKSIKRNEISAEEEFPRSGSEHAEAAARRVADQSKGRPTDDQHSAVIKGAELIAKAEAVKTPAEFETVEAEAAKHNPAIEAHDPDLAARVDAAVSAAEARIQQKED